MSKCRVMIVDDYELWRRHVDAALRRSHKWQLVGEAPDGREAVERARLLRPDLILLDIGLPGEDGIQVATRLLADDPSARILFLSEHQSPELVRAALATGAYGYVVKSNAGRELLPAMSAIVEGRRFISACVSAPEPFHHAVAFYDDEARLLDDFARYAEPIVKAGNVFLVLSIASRREKLERSLRSRGVDVDGLTNEGQIRWLVVEEALSSIMVDDWPDEMRFSKLMAPIVADATARSTARGTRIAAWGECAPTLWRQGKVEAAVRVEQLWDQMARRHQIETFCSYTTNEVPYDEDNGIHQQICLAHSVIR
jgi:CheY-like chemotaxis protein